MSGSRVRIDASDAPAFSLELPPGLIRADIADIDNPPPPFTFASRIAVILAVNGPASITFSVLPAKGGRSLTHLLERAAAERGSQNPSIYAESIGGETYRHPGLSTAISVGCELALFEDGGTVFIMEASGTAEIWTDYQPFLQAAMLSVELVSPVGPKLPLSPGGKAPTLEGGVPDPRMVEARNRETALARKAKEARMLIEAGDFNAAEALVAERNPGPEVCAVIGRLFEDRLRDGGEQDSNIREELHRRALDWQLHAYPEPHTEIEADSYQRGMDEDRTRLAELLGS